MLVGSTGRAECGTSGPSQRGQHEARRSAWSCWTAAGWTVIPQRVQPIALPGLRRRLATGSASAVFRAIAPLSFGGGRLIAAVCERRSRTLAIRGAARFDGLKDEDLDRDIRVDVVVAHEADHLAGGQLLHFAAARLTHDLLPPSAQIEHRLALASADE